MSDGRSDGNPFANFVNFNEAEEAINACGPYLCQEEPQTPEEIRQTRRVRQFRAVQDEALALFDVKNRDYGDAFADYGPVGVLVRLGDKLRRAGNISSTGVTLVKNEGLRDTLLDLHNYAAMAIMLIDEDSPPSGQAYE